MSQTEIEELVCDDDVQIIEPVDYVQPESSVLNGVNNSFFTSILNIPKCLKGRLYDRCSDQETVDLEILECGIKNFDVPDLKIGFNSTETGYGSIASSSRKLEEPVELTFSMRLDDRMINYHTIYQWMNMIRNFETGTGDSCKPEYSTKFTVLTVDGFQCPIGAHTYHNAFPTSLGGYTLDSTGDGGDVYFDVSFKYDHVVFELNDKFGGLLE